MKVLGLVAPFALAESSTKPVQVLRTGRWFFPDYGEVEITSDDLKQYADNFQNRVRRQDIPIVIEHNHELGSYGTVKDLKVSEDGHALYAEPEWTDRGKELIQAKAFNYTSAEIFPEYTDAETHTDYRNVFTAFALTNFPKIKDMQAITAGECLPTALDLEATPKLSFAEILVGMRSQTVDPKTQQQSQQPPVTPPATPPAPIAASEGVVTLQQFAEMQASVKSLELKLGEATTTIAKQQQVIEIERQTRVMLECSEKVDKAKRDGRVTPAQAEEYMKKLPTMADDMREFMFSDIAARPATAVLLGEIGSGGQPAPGATDNDPGSTREALAARQKLIFSEAKKANVPISMTEALKLANKELREGVQR